jgi:hypothetical protein
VWNVQKGWLTPALPFSFTIKQGKTMKRDTFDSRLYDLCRKFVEKGKEGTEQERTHEVAMMLAHLAASFHQKARGGSEWPQTPAGMRLGIAEELQALSREITEDAEEFRQDVD